MQTVDMPLTPAQIEQPAPLAQQLSVAGHGSKTALKLAACQRLGISMGTLHRHLAEVSVQAPRKRRSDAGQFLLGAADMRLLSATLMEGYRANDRKIMSVNLALETLRADRPLFASYTDPATGETRQLSPAACTRALRQMGLHPQQLRRAAPAQPLASDHPNQVWQIDASISTLFYVPGQGQSGLQDMPPGEFYKNKPENFEKIKRQRLTRWVITDHYSGWIFVYYAAGGEGIAGMAQALLAALQDRGDGGMHGVPWMLMMDPGSAGTAGAFMGLLRRLCVQPIVNQAGNPRAKGQVEKAHHLVECDFESGFKLTHVPDLAWINHQAARWMRYYNARRVHTRHGATRSDKWREITQPQLRLAPAPELCRQLLAGKAEPRKVSGPFLHVQFAGHTWDVGAVQGAALGETLHLTHHPYNAQLAYVVRHEGSKDEVLIEVPRVELDAGGFPVGAARIGQEYKRPADTVLDTNRKAIERLATGAATDEAAAAARKAKAVPFAHLGGIDPYKRLDNLPAATPLPRRGTPLAPAGSAPAARVQAAPARVLSGFELANALRKRGVQMTPERVSQLRAWHPEGVPEDQLATLQHRLTVRAGLRVVGGVAANE